MDIFGNLINTTREWLCNISNNCANTVTENTRLVVNYIQETSKPIIKKISNTTDDVKLGLNIYKDNFTNNNEKISTYQKYLNKKILNNKTVSKIKFKSYNINFNNNCTSNDGLLKIINNNDNNENKLNSIFCNILFTKVIIDEYISDTIKGIIKENINFIKIIDVFFDDNENQVSDIILDIYQRKGICLELVEIFLNIIYIIIYDDITNGDNSIFNILFTGKTIVNLDKVMEKTGLLTLRDIIYSKCDIIKDYKVEKDKTLKDLFIKNTNDEKNTVKRFGQLLSYLIIGLKFNVPGMSFINLGCLEELCNKSITTTETNTNQSGGGKISKNIKSKINNIFDIFRSEKFTLPISSKIIINEIIFDKINIQYIKDLYTKSNKTDKLFENSILDILLSEKYPFLKNILGTSYIITDGNKNITFTKADKLFLLYDDSVLFKDYSDYVKNYSKAVLNNVTKMDLNLSMLILSFLISENPISKRKKLIKINKTLNEILKKDKTTHSKNDFKIIFDELLNLFDKINELSNEHKHKYRQKIIYLIVRLNIVKIHLCIKQNYPYKYNYIEDNRIEYIDNISGKIADIFIYNSEDEFEDNLNKLLMFFNGNNTFKFNDAELVIISDIFIYINEKNSIKFDLKNTKKRQISSKSSQSDTEISFKSAQSSQSNTENSFKSAQSSQSNTENSFKSAQSGGNNNNKQDKKNEKEKKILMQSIMKTLFKWNLYASHVLIENILMFKTDNEGITNCYELSKCLELAERGQVFVTKKIKSQIVFI